MSRIHVGSSKHKLRAYQQLILRKKLIILYSFNNMAVCNHVMQTESVLCGVTLSSLLELSNHECYFVLISSWWCMWWYLIRECIDRAVCGEVSRLFCYTWLLVQFPQLQPHDRIRELHEKRSCPPLTPHHLNSLSSNIVIKFCILTCLLLYMYFHMWMCFVSIKTLLKATNCPIFHRSHGF